MALFCGVHLAGDKTVCTITSGVFLARVGLATQRVARRKGAFRTRMRSRSHSYDIRILAGGIASVGDVGVASCSRPPANYASWKGGSGTSVSVAVGNDPSASPAQTPQFLVLEDSPFSLWQTKMVARDFAIYRAHTASVSLGCRRLVGRRIACCTVRRVSPKLPAHSRSHSVAVASLRPPVPLGIHGDWGGMTHCFCLQPSVALFCVAALPTMCIALPEEMPAPISMSGGVRGS